ncbi:unnamed protein product [Hymenolepis diminuta]|uniref:CCDC66 domain-containing protein n=1 Tax=Hymenolepis diminuta TaxID=6216 RepID=A0A0R3SBE4_HYMDI|nr:unnamed protein product [Hymenolepis diminuta]
MHVVNQTADSAMQGANGAIRMANSGIGGAVNAINRGVSGTVNAATGAIGAIGHGARDIVYGAADTVGYPTGITNNTNGHTGFFENGNNGRPSSDYPPPRYSEVPERDYSDNRPYNSFSNKGEVEMNSDYRVTNGGFDSTNNNRNGNIPKMDLQKVDISTLIFQKMNFNLPKILMTDGKAGNKTVSSATQNEKIDQLIDLINQMPARRDRRREDETQIQTQRSRERGGYPGLKWETGNNREFMESQSPDNFRTNRGMNESYRRKINWPKFGKKKTQAEYQEIATKKVCNAEIDMVPCMVPRITCSGPAGRCYCGPMKCCSGSANIDVGLNGNYDYDNHFGAGFNGDLRGGLNRQRRFSGGYDSGFNGDLNGDFTGDCCCQCKYNGNHDLRNRIEQDSGICCCKPRRRSYSGSYDKRPNNGYNGGMISGANNDTFNGGMISGANNGTFNGGMISGANNGSLNGGMISGANNGSFNGGIISGANNGSFNGGMISGANNGTFNGGTNSGVNNGMIEGFDMSINNGYNNGMSNGFNSNGMSGGMGENMNMSAGYNMLDSNSLAALSGICKSLDAINGVLGGLTGNLNNMNGNASIGTEGNMGMDGGLSLGMNVPSGMNMGVSRGNRMDPGMGGSSGVGQSISTGIGFGGMNSSAQVGAGAQGVNISGFGKSMTNLGKPVSQYSNQSTNSSNNNRSSSVPPHGFRESISSDLNTTSFDDGDYEIQYIEPDMDEYNQKVKEAQERAERKRQELIIQRDEEVARKRKEMEKQIEEEYERRKAEAKRQHEAEIKAKVSKAQSDLKKKEQNLMQTFTQKLRAARDAETEKRRRYEIEVAEANHRSHQLKQQLAQQIQTVTNVPSYQSDATVEQKLLAEFSQQMNSIKGQEQKIQEEAANVPLPPIEKPEIPEVVPESVPMPERKEVRIPKPKPTRIEIPQSSPPAPPTCQEMLPLYQSPCPQLQQQCYLPQPQSFCMRDHYPNDANDTRWFRCACRVDASGLAHLVACQVMVMDLDVTVPLVDAVVQMDVANRAECQDAALKLLRDVAMDHANASPQSALVVVNHRNVVNRLTGVSVRFYFMLCIQ